MEKIIQMRMTDGLYARLEKAIEVHEQRTGLAVTVSEFIRQAVSEKISRG